jgi:hypothetical protein
VQIATGIETELAKTTSYATIGNQIIGGDNHMYLKRIRKYTFASPGEVATIPFVG